MNRRDFITTLASATAATAFAQPPAKTRPLIGIQIAGHSLLDEGMERCLDLVQSTCRANAIFLYSHSYYAAHGRAPELYADHGVPVRDERRRKITRVWLRHHAEAFKGTSLGVPEPTDEYGDRDLLRKAVAAGLRNQDGRARGDVGGIYQRLSYDELKPLLPAILEAIVTPAPSGEMFADGIRVEGLRLLAKHRIKEGISACVKYTREQNPWASEKRTPELMKILLTYGTHGKAVIPELKKIADYFEKDEKDFPKKLMLMKARSVRETIAAIEASTESPELIRIR